MLIVIGTQCFVNVCFCLQADQSREWNRKCTCLKSKQRGILISVGIV